MTKDATGQDVAVIRADGVTAAAGYRCSRCGLVRDWGARPCGCKPQAYEQWATMSPPDKFSDGQPRICLWGDKRSALENRDPDERVCRVRVEVLEVLALRGDHVRGDREAPAANEGSVVVE